MNKFRTLLQRAIADGRTITSIASKAGCSRQTIYNIIDGSSPDVELAKRIARAAGFTAQFLVSVK